MRIRPASSTQPTQQPGTGSARLIGTPPFLGDIPRSALIAAGLLPLLVGGLAQMGERANLLERGLGLWISVIFSALLLSAIGWWAAEALSRTTAEQRVVERDRERLSEGIRAAVAMLETASPQILASTTLQAASASEQSAAIQQTSNSSHHLRQAAELTRDRARAVLDATRSAAAAVEEGRQASGENVAGIQDSRNRARTAAERVLALAERAQAIGDLVAAVDEIAEQSNLLAVNAAIEAARAGEVGKSFTVVASEIRGLAEQSRAATSQVRAMLVEIQQASQAAVMATDQGIRASEAREALARHLEEIVHLLADNLDQASHAAQQIEAAAAQQIEDIDEVGLAIREIQSTSGQNTAATHEVERAAEDMHELSARLEDLVAQPSYRHAEVVLHDVA